MNGKYAGGISASFWTQFGNSVGAYVKWTQEIEVDEITLSEWAIDPINVVQGAIADTKPVNLGSAINSDCHRVCGRHRT